MWLRTVPQSSTATCRMSRASPVSTSTSATATWQPKGKDWSSCSNSVSTASTAPDPSPALPARRRADGEHERSVRSRAGRAKFGGQAHGGHLHVDGEPDPQLQPIAPLTAGALLAPELVVARGPKRKVERAEVVARVVGEAGLRGERELASDQVAPPQLGRVHEIGRASGRERGEVGGG